MFNRIPVLKQISSIHALLSPGDKILGFDLSHGGHLTHGAKPNLSGKWFESVQYGVRADDHLIDFDEIQNLAYEKKTKNYNCRRICLSKNY